MGDVMHYKSHKLGLKNRQFNTNGTSIHEQGGLPHPHHPSNIQQQTSQPNGSNQGKIRTRDKSSQRRLIASSNIYAKRYSMAATNKSLQDIEQVRQQQKQEARERKRLEMIETQKQIEEMNKNQPYPTNIPSPPQQNQQQQTTPTKQKIIVAQNNYKSRQFAFTHNDDLKSPENALKENEVVNARQQQTAIKKRKPKKKITYKLNGEKFVIYDYYKPTKILGKGAYAVVMLVYINIICSNLLFLTLKFLSFFLCGSKGFCT